MHRIEVPYIDQSVKYPTGCESVTAVMLLQYLGYDMDVDCFIETCLDCRNFEQRGETLYGPNPYEQFVGSPYDNESFGCYAPVICKALRKVLSNEYEILDETGTEIEDLLEAYINQGMPVILWACINLREPIEGPCWKLLDTGEEFTWISNEHCMLLVGYDETMYYFNDPYENNGVIGYEKALVKDRHRAQHMQAVGVKRR